MDQIRIRGARTHNLKNLNVDLPRSWLIVIPGLSGSGNSSLASDPLHAEAQRRYVESLSAYARQFLQLMEKPDVDLIDVGLFHQLQELARVGRKRLDVAALSFRVEGVEGERGFSRARQPRDHDQPVSRQIDVQVLEIVRARAADADLVHWSVREAQPASIRNSAAPPLLI